MRTADFVRVDMDDDCTAEFTGWAVADDADELVPVFFVRSLGLDRTAELVRQLLAADYHASSADDDARVPGRSGVVYVASYIVDALRGSDAGAS